MALDAYARAGVDYDPLDRFKRAGQAAARETFLPATTLGIREVPESRGESCFLLEFSDHFLAFLVEGLGTKNVVADLVAIAEGSEHSYYEAIGQDTVAMIVNDLGTSGAQTLVVGVECAVGSSDWFADQARADALVAGWQKGIRNAGALYGPGETPALKDVVMPSSVVLSGAAMGIIAPKERRIIGNIQPGDQIIGFTAPGVNANGLTLCRKIASELPNGYLTELPSGKTFGEALLAPTPIYSLAVSDMRTAGLDIHYAANITGHGWRKLMRAKTEEKFSYVIDRRLPPIPEIFVAIQHYGKVSTHDMFSTYNMGMGYALMVPRGSAQAVVEFVNDADYGFRAFCSGHVELSHERQVVLPDYNIFYPENSLNL